MDTKISPMMVQWHACKKAAGSAVLLFRLGDFYEAFYDDAVILSKELDLTLTKRQELPMAGVPAHTCEAYIDKLVAKGYRVAIAEQTEDPKKTKGIVKRELVRVITPGTVINSALLSDKNNNYFTCFTRVGALFGLACLDLTTSEFKVIEFEQERDFVNELHTLRPTECLTSKKFAEKHPELMKELHLSFNPLINTEEDWKFDHQITYGFLASHMRVHSLDGFGLKGLVAGINAAGALLAYLKDTLSQPIDQIRHIQTYSTAQFMSLDRITQRNLELTESLQDGSRRNTLLAILDHTRTPMGARLIRHWIKQPLLNLHEIHKRQSAIQSLLSDPIGLDKLGSLLDQIRDLERLMMKISSGNASPRDLQALKVSLTPIPSVKSYLSKQSSAFLSWLGNSLHEIPELTETIAKALVDEPPLRLNEGNIFKDGYNANLDELRLISRDSKTWIANYQVHLREETGIKSLKVGFTRISGFYIEVSKGQVDKMPTSFQRRQTLVNGERYITPELKEYEEKVLHAEEKMIALESELFQQLRLHVASFADRVNPMAQALAQIDCLHSLAVAARRNHYACPEVNESNILQIEEGRHPVIEASCCNEKFVPNDTYLDEEKQRLFIITGPNMAGKSTYIRQVALITIMAQMGSFIPAKKAVIGLIDKVFTRIGASDDLSRGHSTFMVEMTETANILNNATARSLVILDEIGRGTSTYDGISIAWSVAEYLLTTDEKTPKTLFATHYWELTKMEEKVPGAVNYHIAVHESEEHIVFLRKIVKGSTDKSYGIHVARLAGIPLAVIHRAREILVHLEENANRKNTFEPSKPKRIISQKTKSLNDEIQLTLFG